MVLGPLNDLRLRIVPWAFLRAYARVRDYKLLYLNEQFYSVYSESYVLIHSSVHYPYTF